MIELATAKKDEIGSMHVIVDFGSGIPSDIQGRALLAMEKLIREMGVPVECFKRTMQDDSKLRRSMTKEQRAAL